MQIPIQNVQLPIQVEIGTEKDGSFLGGIELTLMRMLALAFTRTPNTRTNHFTKSQPIGPPMGVAHARFAFHGPLKAQVR